MARSQRLRDEDIRSVIRVVREACELGEDPIRWRNHVMHAMTPMIDATMRCIWVGHLPFDPSAVAPIIYTTLNVDEKFDRYIAEGSVTDNPVTPYISDRLHTTFTSLLEQMCPANVWLNSQYYNEFYRPQGYDDMVVSIVGMPNKACFSCIGASRSTGDAPFTERDRSIVHLLHTSIAEMWKDSQGDRVTRNLPKRQRETLEYLRRGMRESEVAEQMEISAHTVHDYVKAIYRSFGVQSRSALMRTLSEQRKFHPQLV